MNLRENKLCRLLSLVLLLFICGQIPLTATAYQPNRENVFYQCQTDKKLLALTFDDGPHPRYTPQILEILSSYHIPATFFMVGENIKNYPDAARAVVRAGHEIGNHTDTHPSLRHISDEGLLKEIESATERIEDLLGKKPTVFRPPQGVCSEKISHAAQRLGYSVILWAVDTKDWAGTPSHEIVRHVEKCVKSGDILLFHDYVSCENTTVAALKTLIPHLLSRGYTFVTVSELMQEEKRFLSAEGKVT